MTGKMKYMEGNIIFIESSDKLIPVLAAYREGRKYSIVRGYARTAHKVMG